MPSSIYGIVHRRAYPSAKRSAALHGHSLRTEYTWRESGNPMWRRLSQAEPWVVEVMLMVVKAQHELAEWSRPRLEERERELGVEIGQAMAKVFEATVTKADRSDLVHADHVLMELLAERQAVSAQLEKAPTTERGH